MQNTRADDPSQQKETKIRASGKYHGLEVLLRWKTFIVFNVVAVTLLAVIISLLLPKWYRATARVLPPKEGDPIGALGEATSLLKGLASGSLGGLGGSEGAYNYFAILNSRKAMEDVVTTFGLIAVYDVADSSMEDAIEALEDNVMFELQDEGYISIEVLDRDPQRAADMANHFVKVLNEISIHLGTQEARNNRKFIGERLRDSEEILRQAEDSLQVYQERSGIIISPDPTTIGDSPVAELYAMKAKREIELAILLRSTSRSNALVQQLELELSEINKQIALYPAAGIESLRLFRDVVVQQKLLEFLVPMYEQAKIEEQKDVPVLLVLDEAVAPERKVKPQRILIVFLAFVLTVFVTVPMIFLMDRILTELPGAGTLDRKVRDAVESVARKYRVLSPPAQP